MASEQWGFELLGEPCQERWMRLTMYDLKKADQRNATLQTDLIHECWIVLRDALIGWCSYYFKQNKKVASDLRVSYQSYPAAD